MASSEELRAQADMLYAQAAEVERTAVDDTKDVATLVDDDVHEFVKTLHDRVTSLEGQVSHLFTSLRDVIAYHGDKGSTDPSQVEPTV